MKESKVYIDAVADFCCFLVDNKEGELVSEDFIQSWFMEFPNTTYCKLTQENKEDG